MHEIDFFIFFLFFSFFYILMLTFRVEECSQPLNSFDIKIFFLKMRDVANPGVNIKIGPLLIFSFKTMYALESIGA